MIILNLKKSPLFVSIVASLWLSSCQEEQSKPDEGSFGKDESHEEGKEQSSDLVGKTGESNQELLGQAQDLVSLGDKMAAEIENLSKKISRGELDDAKIDLLFRSARKPEVLKSLYKKNPSRTLKKRKVVITYLHNLYASLSSEQVLEVTENRGVLDEIDNEVSRSLADEFKTAVGVSQQTKDAAQMFLEGLLAIGEANLRGDSTVEGGVNYTQTVNQSDFVQVETAIEDGILDAVTISSLHKEFPSVFEKLQSGINDYALKNTDRWFRSSDDMEDYPIYQVRGKKITFDGKTVSVGDPVGIFRQVLGEPDTVFNRFNSNPLEYDGIDSYSWDEFSMKGVGKGSLHQVNIGIREGAAIKVGDLLINRSTTPETIRDSGIFELNNGYFHYTVQEGEKYGVTLFLTDDKASVATVAINAYK